MANKLDALIARYEEDKLSLRELCTAVLKNNEDNAYIVQIVYSRLHTRLMVEFAEQYRALLEAGEIE